MCVDMLPVYVVKLNVMQYELSVYHSLLYQFLEVIYIPCFQMKSIDQLLQLTICVLIIHDCRCSKQSKQGLRETKLKPVECQFWYRCGFFYTVSTGAISWGKLEGGGMMLTTHQLLAPALRISGAIPQLILCACCDVPQGDLYLRFKKSFKRRSSIWNALKTGYVPEQKLVSSNSVSLPSLPNVPDVTSSDHSFLSDVN